MFEQVAPQMSPAFRHTLVGVITLLLAALVIRIVMRIRRRLSASKPVVKRRPKAMTRPETAPLAPAIQPAPAFAFTTIEQRATEELANKPAIAPSVVSERISFEPKSVKSPSIGRKTSKNDFKTVSASNWQGTPVADDSDYVLGGVTSALAQLLPESDERKQKLSVNLKNAGYYSAHAWHNLAAIRCLGIILPILLCLGLLVIAPENAEPILMIGLVSLPLIGWSLPTLFVRSKAKSRLDEMSRGMPDMLDLLNMCVSQGMTVPSALTRVSGEIEPVYPALAKELKIVTEQAKVGTLDQALRGFSARVDVPEVHSFTSLMIQTEQMGTSMSEALTGYSDSMRESFRQQADQKANSATFKMLFPTVICLMPAVFMFLLGPAVIELNDFFKGRGQEILDSNSITTEMSTARGVAPR